jgi:hypothetical protein
MLCLLLIERGKKKKRERERERNGLGAFFQGKYALLAVPCQDFPAC